MSEGKTSASGGIGFLGMLAILFIGLKLTNHIDWSWWWVLAPLWAPVAAVVAGGVVFVGFFVVRQQVRRFFNPPRLR